MNLFSDDFKRLVIIALVLLFINTAEANGDPGEGMTIIQTPAGPVLFCTEVSPGFTVCH